MWGQHLDGHRAVQDLIVTLIHIAHATLADLVQNLVFAQPRGNVMGYVMLLRSLANIMD